MQENEKNKVILPASIAMGITGAIVGGTVAAARGIKDIRENKTTKDVVVTNVLKESAGSGLSTAIGTAAVGSFKLTNPILGGLSFAAITIGTKCLFDYATGSQNSSQGEDLKGAVESDKNENLDEAPAE